MTGCTCLVGPVALKSEMIWSMKAPSPPANCDQRGCAEREEALLHRWGPFWGVTRTSQSASRRHFFVSAGPRRCTRPTHGLHRGKPVVGVKQATFLDASSRARL